MATKSYSADARSLAHGDISLTDLHNRVTAGDRTALEAIAEHALPELRRRVRGAFPRITDDAVEDAVVDAFLDYASHSDRFQQSNGEPLSRFLYRAAWRNAADSLKREARRQKRELCYASESRGRTVLPSLTERGVVIEDRTRECILDSVIDGREREALLRWLDGETGTLSLAQTLGFSALAKSEQRREVKRFKDRVLKRIARLSKSECPDRLQRR